MKKLFMSAVALLFAGALWAQENPLWMRHCAISPDGTTIAFTYKVTFLQSPYPVARLRKSLPIQLLIRHRFGVLIVSRLLLLPTAWEVWTYLLCRKTVESLAV